MVLLVIVDDEEMIRGLLEQTVALLGWTSRSAATGIQGLQMVRQEVPHGP
jgi:CheY-like chemotaxis protein